MSVNSLQFRRSTSFNAHDTKLIESEAGRTTVRNGVKRRCELVLNTLLREGKMALGGVTTHLQKAFSASYTAGDVSRALFKLRSAGLVIRRGKGRGTTYAPSRNALTRWRSLDKTTV